MSVIQQYHETEAPHFRGWEEVKKIRVFDFLGVLYELWAVCAVIYVLIPAPYK